MPAITPKAEDQPGENVRWQQHWIVLIGDTFDECQSHRLNTLGKNNMVFIPPFDHPKVIEGQGTVGKEILDELSGIDYIFVPVGDGGLLAV